MFDILIYESLWMVFIFSAIPLLISSFFGLIVSIIQAATQIQEQSISFFVKFISISVTLFAFTPLAIRELVVFIQNIFNSYSHF